MVEKVVNRLSIDDYLAYKAIKKNIPVVNPKIFFSDYVYCI